MRSLDALQGLHLLGGPRCGSTTLVRALGKHPEVCVSQPKETFFFLRPPEGVPESQLGSQFFRCFPDADPTCHRVRLEGTPFTLYDEEALDLLLRVDPNARFLVSARNPVELVRSHHARALFSLDEEVEDFAEAWSLESARRNGQQLPARCRDPRVLHYRQIGAVGAAVAALVKKVGRERCHVVVFDDLVSRGEETLAEVFRFAGLVPVPGLAPRHYRPHAGYRSRWLQAAVMNPPRAVMKRAEKWERQGKGRGGFLKPIRRRLKQWNTQVKERPPLAPAFDRELRETFAPDVHELGALIGRDLSHWL